VKKIRDDRAKTGSRAKAKDRAVPGKRKKKDENNHLGSEDTEDYLKSKRQKETKAEENSARKAPNNGKGKGERKWKCTTKKRARNHRSGEEEASGDRLEATRQRQSP